MLTLTYFLDNPTIQSSVFDKTWPGNPIPLVPYENPPAFQNSYTSSNSRHQNTILHTKNKNNSISFQTILDFSFTPHTLHTFNPQIQFIPQLGPDP